MEVFILVVSIVGTLLAYHCGKAEGVRRCHGNRGEG